MAASIFRNAGQILLPVKFAISRRLCLASQSPPQLHGFSNLDSLVSAVITAVTSCASISNCRSIHCKVMKSLSFSHGFIGDQLVSAYLRLGFTKDACNMFDELPDRDLVSWNSFISGFSRRGDLSNCLNAFSAMKLETGVEANEGTIVPLISACTETRALDIGTYIHGFILKFGMLLELRIANVLINMYGKSGYLDGASGLFEAIPIPNLVSWNSIIAVHVQTGKPEEGIGYFIRSRRAGIKPDQGTLITTLEACEELGSAKLAEAIHGFLFITGLDSNLTLATGLLSLYSKLGSLVASQKVFGHIRNPDSIAWTAMLASYGVHGKGKEAVKTFKLMVKEGVAPDHVTFTHLLNACSHAGLLKEGRAGLLSDAYKLIISMPMKPNSGVWGALMGACKKHNNIELGKEAFDNMLALEPLDSRNYLSLSNMYSSAGLRKEASEVRGLMKKRSVIRIPGSSCIEHEKRIHRFVSGDRSHPLEEEISKKLEELVKKVRGSGAWARTEFVLQDVDDEEVREDMINKHSEKLAIAFGLMVSANLRMPLVITKNLRICGDCHEFAKVVSRLEGREIIIRDTKRFHHFSNGSCSCRDYW
ncbi:unnamed protein product [Linum tenue]|uniref:DYW domain-containing protein n=1 Tax=Linum tenue TaxID=586396 RepID=A0AAV0HAK4_9ROSI|nr:unnamed protein product [Linum tenue]